jgi:thioredoxin reductase
MNCQVDVIIIGDSKEGREAVKALASERPTIKFAFISREFKSFTTHDYLNVEYIKEEVVFTDYKNRLFGCYLKNGDRIYGTHLIIATGLAYEPFVLNRKTIPCVFNTTEDLPKTTKMQPAVVVGQNNSDVKFALAVAKKYAHVYLCTEGLTIENITSANVKKLAETDNLVVLPNASIIKANISDGQLKSVELSNYSTVTCNAIFIKTKASPETSFVPNNIISKDENGYIKTTNVSQSLLVPKCFAIGNCSGKSTKKMKDSMIEIILKDFIGGNK